MQEKDNSTGGGNKGRNLKATFLFFSKACKKYEPCTYDSLYSSEISGKLLSLKKSLNVLGIKHTLRRCPFKLRVKVSGTRNNHLVLLYLRKKAKNHSSVPELQRRCSWLNYFVLFFPLERSHEHILFKLPVLHHQ